MLSFVFLFTEVVMLVGMCILLEKHTSTYETVDRIRESLVFSPKIEFTILSTECQRHLIVLERADRRFLKGLSPQAGRREALSTLAALL